MRVQSVNNQQNCCKNPSFEKVEVKFIENESKPLVKMLEESYGQVVLQGKNKEFNPSKYIEKYAQGFSDFLEKHGIEDGKIQVFRAYDYKKPENRFHVTYELGRKHIEGRDTVLVEDLFKGEDEMDFKPMIESLNRNYPYTMVNYFDSSNNPFRIFAAKNANESSHPVVICHQENPSRLRVKQFLGFKD